MTYNNYIQYLAEQTNAVKNGILIKDKIKAANQLLEKAEKSNHLVELCPSLDREFSKITAECINNSAESIIKVSESFPEEKLSHLCEKVKLLGSKKTISLHWEQGAFINNIYHSVKRDNIEAQLQLIEERGKSIDLYEQKLLPKLQEINQMISQSSTPKDSSIVWCYQEKAEQLKAESSTLLAELDIKVKLHHIESFITNINIHQSALIPQLKHLEDTIRQSSVLEESHKQEAESIRLKCFSPLNNIELHSITDRINTLIRNIDTINSRVDKLNIKTNELDKEFQLHTSIELKSIIEIHRNQYEQIKLECQSHSITTRSVNDLIQRIDNLIYSIKIHETELAPKLKALNQAINQKALSGLVLVSSSRKKEIEPIIQKCATPLSHSEIKAVINSIDTNIASINKDFEVKKKEMEPLFNIAIIVAIALGIWILIQCAAPR